MKMSNPNQTVLRCRVRKTTAGYEGTISVPGLKPTKLTKKDDTTTYANASGVQSAAKTLATRLGFGLEVEDTQAPAAKKTKKATTSTTTG